MSPTAVVSRRTVVAAMVPAVLDLAACSPKPVGDASTPPPMSPARRSATRAPDALSGSSAPTEAVRAAFDVASATVEPPRLTGDRRNTWAFVRLDDPSSLTVEGEVPQQRAWSTSKVLVVAAFLSVRGVGELYELSSADARAVVRSLTESHMDSLLHLRRQVPHRAQIMTDILRSVGDTVTQPPATKEGSMQWTVGEQTRFMAALHHGRIVSPAVSSLLLAHMQPIASQRWGLGTIGAGAFKGGWLTANSETRQMGIVGDYAVAILTHAVGPAELQSDGDHAHVSQMNLLADRLAARLAVAEKVQH